MKYVMQIKLEGVWTAVRGSGLPHPYEYDTQEEAERMLRICYPDLVREERLGGEQLARAWPKEEPCDTTSYRSTVGI